MDFFVIHFVNDTVMRKIFLFVFLLYASLCRSQLMTIQGTVCDFFTSQMLDSVRLEVLRPDSSVFWKLYSEVFQKGLRSIVHQQDFSLREIS